MKEKRASTGSKLPARARNKTGCRPPAGVTLADVSFYNSIYLNNLRRMKQNELSIAHAARTPGVGRASSSLEALLGGHGSHWPRGRATKLRSGRGRAARDSTRSADYEITHFARSETALIAEAAISGGNTN
ncbi:hypothetical protein EVAR_5888_1 [Eumeta japonica]|uniref:Uncharacterized protein n=1 Tax=Eumeta variegata TaxID=151549 RepID=A0A4C1TD39_EUMVA|nr:hypothetical protein EVAR_5888_1 [Eumeta japonica]